MQPKILNINYINYFENLTLADKNTTEKLHQFMMEKKEAYIYSVHSSSPQYIKPKATDNTDSRNTLSANHYASVPLPGCHDTLPCSPMQPTTSVSHACTATFSDECPENNYENEC